jgi:hypothetical protein
MVPALCKETRYLCRKFASTYEREMKGWWRQLHGEMRNEFTASIGHLKGKDRLGDDDCKDSIKIELKGRGLWG